MQHEGKYGWYPCDWATYRKLKELNMAYTKAMHEKAAWERWDRKEPQNRVIRGKLKNSKGQVVGYQAPIPMPEPELTTFFCKKVVKNVKWGKKGQYYKEGKDETFVELVDSSVPKDYRNARFPVAGQEGVTPLTLTLETINVLHNKLCVQLQS
jgi:hypothetical protein